MIVLFCCFFIFMFMVLVVCKSGVKIFDFLGFIMGMSYNVVVVDLICKVNEVEVKVQIELVLVLVNKQMLNWDLILEILCFNVKIDFGFMGIFMDFVKVMCVVEEVYIVSEGCFDIMMGLLIEFWGFGVNGVKYMVFDIEIVVVQVCFGYSVILNVGVFMLQKCCLDVQVYLFVIGKGYGVDQVGCVFESFGIIDYMVEIGGDFFVFGMNLVGMFWQIGIEKLVVLFGGVLDVVGVFGYGFVLFGDYCNYFEQDGECFFYLIDLVIGCLIMYKIVLVIVLVENVMLVDVWVIVMFILGCEKGFEIVKVYDLVVLFVECDLFLIELWFKIEVSDSFKVLIV